jgi:O-antigen/teichoic acid export membrane protein
MRLFFRGARSGTSPRSGSDRHHRHHRHRALTNLLRVVRQSPPELGVVFAAMTPGETPAAFESSHDPLGDPPTPVLEIILEEIDLAVETVSDAAALAPAVGIAVTGGAMVKLPHDPADSTPSTSPPTGSTPDAGNAAKGESFRSGFTQAGPVAVAGVIVNGTSALVVVAVAHLVTPRSYGVIAQLLGLFFILSMPGSAVLVGVVRRVTALEQWGNAHRVRSWVAKVHRAVMAVIVGEVIVVWSLRSWIARELSLPNDQGVFLILVAGGIWMFLCVDRGLIQARRGYRSLAVNLLIEGSIRALCIVGFVASGMGVSGYALGVFAGEMVATAHARWIASRVWSDRPDIVPPVSDGPTALEGAQPNDVVRRVLIADVSAAFIGLALLGFLQNVDVILLGRINHGAAGAYAAISVASKALVFGALALGSYLLPEATIRWQQGGHAVRQLVVTLTFLAVPAVVLFAIAFFVPKWFLDLIFSERLSSAAPAFASLVGAMAFLCVSVLLTNYLFGAGCRWIVLLLLAGSIAAGVLVTLAHGQPLDTARADLIVQAALATAMTVAFIVIHQRVHGEGRLRRRSGRGFSRLGRVTR